MSKYTISQLQKMLEERQSKLEELTQERQSLLVELKKIDTQIEELSGESLDDTFTNVEIPKNGQKKKKVTGRKTSVDYAKEVLAHHPDGLDLEELSEAVLKAGYPTNSKNFSNSLYQSLYKNPEVIRNSEGRYQLVEN